MIPYTVYIILELGEFSGRKNTVRVGRKKKKEVSITSVRKAKKLEVLPPKERNTSRSWWEIPAFTG